MEFLGPILVIVAIIYLIKIACKAHDRFLEENAPKSQELQPQEPIVVVEPVTETINGKVYTFGTYHGYTGMFDESCYYFYQDSYGKRNWYRIDKSVNPYLHRTDGPAIEHLDGLKYYYLFGQLYSKENFDEYLKKHTD